MKKMLITLLLILLSVPSLLSANIIGKGLKCEGDWYTESYNHPIVFYFDSERTGKYLTMKGSAVNEYSFSYTLRGPNEVLLYKLIHLIHTTLRRDTLTLRNRYGKWDCTLYPSILITKREFREMLDERLKKNKF